MSCFIIAEVGVNHNGSIELAKELIHRAKDAGADAVKFQTFSAARLACPETPKVAYQRINSGNEESHYAMLRSLELTKSAHFELKSFCEKTGVEFMSTPYDVDSARFLNDEVGVKRFKTASADLVDIPLHRYIHDTGKQVIVSTGMATIGEIESTLLVYGEMRSRLVTLMHCTSNYPCQDLSVNLRALKMLEKAFQVRVGYSDHSEGNIASVIAVAYGATIIEKHFTLDKNMKGPDHKASVDPHELEKLIRDIRRAESMLGSGIKKIEEEEKEMRIVSRKSVRAARKIYKGEVITDQECVLLRPGAGLVGNQIDLVLGKRARHDIEKHMLITSSDIE